MDLEIDTLKQIGLNVYENVHPLLGKKVAAQISNRGAGGDMTMYIDTLAENTIIENLENLGLDLLLISEEVGEKFK
jgi:fructose-1,6-bisphosphatase/inositol monophosphatase family enzyme